MHLPIEISIHVKKKDKDQYLLQYAETFDYDLPKKDAEFTINTGKKLGVEIHQKGRTFSYEKRGSIDAMAGMIAIEFMSQTSVGKITINELLSLASIGIANLRKAPK